jgi:hypothetical protein
VELEERTIEELPDRCQSCGATLTDAEKEAVLESGASVVLCAICTAEEIPLEDEEEGEGAAA